MFHEGLYLGLHSQITISISELLRVTSTLFVCFSRQGFSVALEVLELFVDQAGLELRDLPASAS